VSQAAKAIGRARSTLNRDIAQGKVSVTRNGTGQPYIEIVELERVYGQVDIRTLAKTVRIGQDGTVENRPEIVALQRELALVREERERERQQAETVAADLRHRLDQADTDRRQALDRLAAAQERIAALLTDQRAAAPPARRSWWRWRSR
jgi:hypothetical protein